MGKSKDEIANINLLIVFDAAAIIKGNPKPSQDKKKPLPVKSNTQYVFYSRTNMVQEDSQLPPIFACPGDRLKIRGITVNQNSIESVIIYQIKSSGWPGIEEVFEPVPVTIEKAVQPNAGSYDGLPGVHSKENFTSMDAIIQSTGRKKYRICFALYSLAEDGETQNLTGYYYWDMKISILNFTSPVN